MESDDLKRKAAAEAALARAEQHQLILKEVAEIGLRMCDRLRKQAEAGTTDIAVAARDFDRLSREVCRTIALRHQIRQDAARIVARIAAERAAADRRVAGRVEAAPTGLSKPRPQQSAARARLERDFLADANAPSPEKRGLLH